MKSYKLFEKTYNIDIDNLYNKTDDNTEQELKNVVIRKRQHLKRSYDEFFKKSVGHRIKNDGSVGEEIVRLVFKGINLNSMTKNNPYVDIYTDTGIPGLTRPGELINVKSTKKFKSLSDIVTTTKAIELESLLNFYIFKQNNYRGTFNIKPVIYDIIDYYDEKIKDLDEGYNDQSNYRNIIYIILKHSTDIGIGQKNIKIDIDKYILDIDKDPKSPYSEDIEDIIMGIRNDKTPVSLAFCYSEDEIIKIKKTDAIGLGVLVSETLNVWETDGLINKHNFSKNKKLTISQLAKVYGIMEGDDLFPVNINIDLSKDGKEYPARKDGSRRKRLTIATELMDATFTEEHEDEILSTIDSIIKELEVNPSKLDSIKDIL